MNAVLNAELFVTTTPMCAPHSLTPPHTPQLSSAAEAQHVPPGERGTSQQTPFTSTATPVPLHTPQPSSTPSQHCPLDDRVAVGEQHFPVVLSIKPVQHTPDVSTTPVQASRVDWIEIREHEGPIQPVLHSHTCRAVLHIQCPMGAGQSAVVLHPHDTSVSHCAIDTGSSPATQTLASGTGNPVKFTQVTLRDMLPSPQPVLDTQSPHFPVAHRYDCAGHGNRLHALIVLGSGKPASTHTDELVTVSPSIQSGGSLHVMPSLVSVPSKHSEEQGCQREGEDQWGPTHG